MTAVRVALAQLNLTVGDLDGNLDKLLEAYREGADAGAHVVVFSELATTGYPPEDLLLKPGFVADNRRALEAFAAATTSECAAVVGFVDANRDLYNAAAVCAGGQTAGVYHKRLLPNYAVFDEARYFTSGHDDPVPLYRVAGCPVGISVCEDIWSPAGPLAVQAAGGAELSININASPYHHGKRGEREQLLATRARDAHSALIYVNQVGGQDELLFDGASMAFDAEGTLLARAGQFAEELLLVDVPVPPSYRRRLLDPRGRTAETPLLVIEVTEAPAPSANAPRATAMSATTPEAGEQPLPAGEAVAPAAATPTATYEGAIGARIASTLEPIAELYEALVLGTRDYCTKNGFTDVVIGLSGGIDSTLVACVATDALGADHVHGVSMPSRYSSDHSRTDAHDLADNLGIDFRTISIEPAFAAFLDVMGPSFEGREPGLTYENLQSRCRGQTLMALSNEFGWMVLTTGNKSELAVGYFTLYGDSVGGYAVIKDVLKLDTYHLCRYINERAGMEVIPENVIVKPPSAELRPDQRDDQSLPPYEILDPILDLYIERDHTAAEIIELGYDGETVRRITRLVDLAEYKRRQSPPGVRVSTKAFGKDRRMPITSRYRG